LLAKEFDEALAAYQTAASLKPQEAYPQEKVGEINAALGEIAAKEALDQQYQEAIAIADQALLAKEFDEALAAYQTAASLKPQEDYPQGKIDEINATLGELAAKEALDQQYQEAIANADKALLAKEYDEALAAYQTAASLKPQEAYPQEKVGEINVALGEIAAKEALDQQYQEAIADADKALLAKEYDKALAAYQTAASLKPQEAYPQKKVGEINAALGEIAAKEALDQQYQEAIANADKALLAEEYDEALAAYQTAASLKPQETYPQDKVDEINAALGEIATKEALDQQYQEAIANADKALLAKEYDEALTAYQTAASLKPQEEYAQAKVIEVETTIAEQTRKLEIDQQYITTIATADENLANNNYEEARTGYQQALALKPTEEYPGKQILQIDHTLETMAAERDLAYQSAISKADAFFEQKDYEMAKLQYDRALELKPEETYPVGKLKQVNDQILVKRQLVQQQFDKAIIDADKFFSSKVYDEAIASYRAASVLKPEEKYPKEMVGRILKLLSERSIVQLNKDPLLIPNNTQYKFDFVPVAVKDRKSNYIFFKAKNVSDREYKLIISFGNDQSKNGGVVIRVPSGKDLYEFIVRISAQYKWFSDDNNWISFYPEGGDFEVSLMQISYSD